MDKKKQDRGRTGDKRDPAGRSSAGPVNAEKAHDQADLDISQDPDLSIHSPNDDLDEGETARLGEDTSGII